MQAVVTTAYTDKNTGAVRMPGDKVDETPARIAELVDAGVVESKDVQERRALDGMTVKQLRDYIAKHGKTAPKKATKAQLLNIAKGL